MIGTESSQSPGTSNPVADGETGSPTGPDEFDNSSKVTIEAGANPTQHELKIARKLAAEGDTVVIRRVSVTGRTSDYFVNGVETELKTVSQLSGKDTSGALSSRIMEGVGQARSIIVDVTEQAGMSRALAERAIVRVWGRVRLDGVPIDSLRIIGKDFDISSVYVP